MLQVVSYFRDFLQAQPVDMEIMSDVELSALSDFNVLLLYQVRLSRQLLQLSLKIFFHNAG